MTNNNQYILRGNENSMSLPKQNATNCISKPIMYMSRNKFLKKYGFSAVIFDTYVKEGRIPYHRTGKVIEVEENSTLAILRIIEIENAEAAQSKSVRQPVVKPKQIVLNNGGIKIRRRKLDA